MIRLDSLDVTLDTSPLPAVAFDRLTLKESTDAATGETRTAYTAKGNATGLIGLTGVLATDSTVSLRFTGQAMGDRYADGISLDTLDELADRASSTGLLTVTREQLLAGTVRRADPVADVYAADLDGIGEACRLLGRTTGRGTRVQGRGESVTLYHRLPDGEGTLRTYGKADQLERAAHRSFREAYPAAVRQLAGYQRCEVAAQTYHATRRIAGLAEGVPTVADVLNSTRSPVADALDALLATWCGRRRALHSLPSVPDSFDALLAQPPASPSADAYALLAALLADLAGGDYDAATAAVRARYGSKNCQRLYPAIRSACESYGRPAAADAHAEAVDILRIVSSRVRERERA